MFAKLFGNAPTPSAAHNVKVIDPAVVRQWYEAGETVLVDVREPAETAAERIPGSVLLPLSSFDPAQMPDHQGKRLVIHCRSGQRCGMAAERLFAAGWTGEVNRMAGGIIGWKAAGGKVTPG